MKLTNPETIQESEKDFIDTINAELDWEAIEKMLLEKHSFTLQEEIEYKEGDLIVYKDEIAYKFDFEIKVPLSVIFNREGDCLEISTLRDDFEDEEIQDLDDIEKLEDIQAPEETETEETETEETETETETETEKLDPENIDQKEETLADEVHIEQESKVAQMASNIADMISEINQGDE
ncbi:MAG: hypothetical protein ABIJ59_14180 [Pseudomonadota bacterium]